ncbi:MAG: carbonic anhydrase family protein [Cyanobacteria bacterium P01_D01_bin.156]
MLHVLLQRRVFLQLAFTSFLWDYNGNNGPNQWGTLSADYHTCSDGRQQSPINIDITQAIDAPVSFHYRPIPINLLNNGRTIQETVDRPCTLTLDNQTYNLIQFHLHTPSEHTCNGRHYPMELHLVHRQPETGALAVVGVWIKPGVEQSELTILEQQLPQQPGDRIQTVDSIDPNNLLPAAKTLVCYQGSLTTPPCSEEVTWLIMVNPIEASSQQIDVLHKLLGDNARPLQR